MGCFVIWDDFVVLGVRCDSVVCAAAESAPSLDNKVSAAGISALAGALEKNTGLQKLQIQGVIHDVLIFC